MLKIDYSLVYILRRRFSQKGICAKGKKKKTDLHAALRLFGRSLAALHHGMILQDISGSVKMCFLCDEHHLSNFEIPEQKKKHAATGLTPWLRHLAD